MTHDEWLLRLLNDELEANDQQTTSSVEICEMKILSDYIITSVVKTQINVPFSIKTSHINMRLNEYCQLWYANYKSNTRSSGGSRIFPRGVRQLPKVLLFFNFVPKNCMKMKEFGPQGGARVPGAPP